MTSKDTGKDDQRTQALQAMDYVVQGLQTGVWGIISGYIEHPVVASSIIEGSVRLYLHSLHIYHDQDTAAEYAQRLIKILEPFAAGQVEVDEDNWYESLTPPLLEQLG